MPRRRGGEGETMSDDLLEHLDLRHELAQIVDPSDREALHALAVQIEPPPNWERYGADGLQRLGAVLQEARALLDGGAEPLAVRARLLWALTGGDHGEPDVGTAALLAALDGDTSGADEAVQAALADREAGARRAVAVALVTGDARGAREARSGFDALHAAVVAARRPPARAAVVTEVQPDRPAPLLAAAGRGGSILTAGNVLVLAGEGGVAKSPLALTAALCMADRLARSTSDDPGARLDGTGYGALHGGLFDGAGGQALVVTYEDTAADVAFRLRTLAVWWWGETDPDRATAALRNVRVLADPGPLFGPVAAFGGEGSALYTARPGPLDGWPDLWTAADECPDLRLIVIDPAMAAFAGDQNAAAGVREFYAALRREARARLLGVLLVAHTNKTSRSVSDIYDPGSTAGSTHWTDAARGACRLGWPEDDNYDGGRLLTVCKANYGPPKLRIDAKPVRAPSGEICGFMAGGDWQTRAEHAKAEAEAKRGAAAGGAGKPAAGAAVDPTERAALDAL